MGLASQLIEMKSKSLLPTEKHKGVNDEELKIQLKLLSTDFSNTTHLEKLLHFLKMLLRLELIFKPTKSGSV